MKTSDWWKQSVVYQIYPKSFNDSNGDGIGDIQGIIEKLDYLKKLGIDVIWLSPIYDSPQDDNGYDIRDYRKIFTQYGDMESFDRLLQEVHARNMKLVMDLVVNHTSDEHEWFEASRASKDSPYRDYYFWRDEENTNNWGSIFGGPAWQLDEETGEYYLHLFSKKQPDLNWENANLRQDVYDMMTFWLDKGIDGFRMDVINFISKNTDFPDGPVKNGDLYGDPENNFCNGPRVHEFLREMNREVLGKYDIMTVGEMPGASIEDAQIYTDPKNREVDMIFTFEHMNLDSDGENKWDLKTLYLPDLKKNMAAWQNGLQETGWNSLYWNNHDQPRIVSRFGNDGAYRVRSAKMLATCLHMMKGTPYIYQGEEIGMTNVHFNDLADYQDIETLNMYRDRIEQGFSHDAIMKSIYTKGRDNARTPFQWDSSENAGFTTGTPWLKVNPRYVEINSEAALQDDDSIFYYYQTLIRLRKEIPAVVYGSFKLLLPKHEAIFAYERQLDGEKLVTICNFSAEAQRIEDEQLLTDIARGQVLITNLEDTDSNVLEAYQAIVYKI
ncbi:glycoside hydrolase family 13 protein [Listeria booriae]|uniref:oligo-1,6-glucosidase n=1 Tax=Listeria booriae TaxID=1552123 RepID=A0A7X0WGM1_9LIST|nr:alpha-glucosidase [Listeria booriae]MBC1227244.1 alpha-glucosidase [Listeria booriae]MBC1271286.1 alpha-glucosidase [Listeria booriae]MBC1285947.1 alpha-glucosidase [Listeria booriae]MBC1309239.1 alpha-glucosidase [Listeria booriae]MBC1317526.1 alpha-glucosidase [Listeria booriae]